MARLDPPTTQPDAARGNTRMRLEQWTRNPTCEANTISAVRNVRMATVAKAEGLPVTFGQSPFAIARGNQFERQLFRDDAKRLIPELIQHGVLPDGAKGLLDLRLKRNGGTRLSSLDDAITQTQAFIERLAGNPHPRYPTTPAVVAGATVRIPKGILLPEAGSTHEDRRDAGSAEGCRHAGAFARRGPTTVTCPHRSSPCDGQGGSHGDDFTGVLEASLRRVD